MANKLHFITGGSRSGKSSYALSLSQKYPRKCFIATAEAFDHEMVDRIQKHREERDDTYITIEEPIDLGRALLEADRVADLIVIDCLTVWVGNLMHHHEKLYPHFPQIDSFVDALQMVAGEVLIVSNELGMGLIPSTPMGRQFRDLAGFLNQRVAKICDRATLVVSGIPMVLKGKIMRAYNINAVSKIIEEELQHKINTRTKPVGSLGKLESTVKKIGLIQQTLTPVLKNPHHILFAGDHGIVEMGVSPDKMEVTRQMVLNFLSGGAGINVFCNQHQIEMLLVDSGVNYDFGKLEGIIDLKVGMGTKNYFYGRAMSHEELELCLNRSASVVDTAYSKGSNIIGFGEMGITNTSSSSLIMSALCNIPLRDCVGIGAGHTPKGLEHKYKVLSQVQEKFEEVKEPFEVLRHFGGFEVAMMTGAMLRAAELGMTVLIDGFISTASFIVAHALYPSVMDYAIFCHLSKEGGHRKMLDHLGVEALLDLDLRLGEGTAIALAYPIIQSSVNFLNQMASFEGAGVRLPDNLPQN